MSGENEYVLGTSDIELARLRLQHSVWRDRAFDVWRRAGIGPGHTVVDLGCGPGYTSLDLATVVGPHGRVLAFDASRRFLDALNAAARDRGISTIEAHEVDFDHTRLPDIAADAVWCRWVLMFVTRPRHLLDQVFRLLKPGGVLVFHEYFDYSTWRTSPRCPELEEFVACAQDSWRAAGGDPDVGLSLPAWLAAAGFTVQARPIVDIVPPTAPLWSWVRAFVESGRSRLVEMRHMPPERADEIWRAFLRTEAAPGAMVITPGVLEVVARR